MAAAHPELDWINMEASRMRDRVVAWSQVNSGTYNHVGVRQMADLIAQAIAPLGAEAQTIEVEPASVIDAGGHVVKLPLGPALLARKRPDAPLRVLLSAHLDTVYGVDHPFQNCERLDDKTLRGPGVADIKGGIAVMLTALEALERSQVAGRIGWEILLTPDEEIGAPGSRRLLTESARRCHVGLVFEPALPDGSLVSQRKGSGNFAVVVRGRSAHAGRDPGLGRNAVAAAAELAVALDRLAADREGMTVNIARIDGGEALNIVPDLAVLRFNVRVSDREDQVHVEHAMDRLVRELDRREGYCAELHGMFTSPPKLTDEPTRRFIEYVTACGRSLGLDLKWKPTGGVCDGNRLAAAGLTNLDTMGVRGGELHSDREFLCLDSLVERARLSAAVLLEFARHGLPWNRR